MQLVVMTREMGSLGRDVAGRIAGRMGRKVVYQEIIDQRADKTRVRKSHVGRLLEGGMDLWEKLTAASTSLSIFTADETLRFLTDGDTGVVRGWGAVHLLAGIPHVVRVRICAPLELRVMRMMERVGTTDAGSARREIELSEQAHTAIVQRHFGVNWRDPEHYDLVLSTERLSVDECADEIERVMALPRFQPTEASRQRLRSLALEWSIRAALRRDPRTADARLQLQCNEGLVRVGGCINSDEQAQAIESVVRAVSGVRAVACELRNLSPTPRMRAQA